MEDINEKVLHYLLLNNVVNFKSILEAYQNTKDDKNNSCVQYLFETEELLEELLKNNKLTKDDLKLLFDAVNSRYAIETFSKNSFLLKCIVETFSFQELIDKHMEFSCLYRLLNNEELFKQLIEDDLLTQNDLKCLLDKIERWYEASNICFNISLSKRLLIDDKLNRQFIDKLKGTRDGDFESGLCNLLENEKLFNEMIENNQLTQKDLRYLLEKANEWPEIREICQNAPLIRHLLNEFILNKEDINRFNIKVEESGWCRAENVHTIFEFIKRHNDKLSELTELNELLLRFNFNSQQKIELSKALKNNEFTKSRLKNIVESHLEANFSFDELTQYLNKNEKKIMLNI